MASGFWGKILRVDLSDGKVWVQEPDERFYRTYFGGTGFTAFFLLKDTKPGVDPLGPENVITFSAGPLTGLPFPGSGRHSIGAKSPLTGGFGDSQAGGFWGRELKRTGFDAIVVQGVSEQPVYIAVSDDRAEIRDARDIWGLPGRQCIERIHRDLGTEKARVAYIGPAGENLVRYACVGHDLRAFAGRSGLGAVMGSKHLKAVTVIGSKDVPMSDGKKIKELTRWLSENRLSTPGMKAMTEFGTPRVLAMLNEMGGCPSFNFRQGHFEGADGLSAETMKKTILKGRERCYACPIACKRVVEADMPYPVSSEYGGPEYESLASLGSTCGVSDLAVVARANQLCTDYGLDSISTGVTIAFAMECYEAGLLTKEDTGGLDLRFGNANAVLELIELIGNRRGIGALLAEGTKRASAQIGRGSEKYAMQVKGQEVPMHEPKLKHALGIGYAVSPTGADHCHNMHDILFTTEQAIEDWKALGVLGPVELRDLGPDKIRLASYVINFRHFQNAAVLCQFVPWDINNCVDLVRAATNWNTSSFELMKIGERICTMARVYNLREGFTSKDDVVPARLLEAFTSGPLEGVSIDEATFARAVKYYYEAMGWTEDGVPTTFKLHELGVPWAAACLGR